MKSNDLKRLLKTIQFRTEKTIDEIAAEIGYSRPYLTNQVNIGVNETIKKVLNEKYGSAIKQDVSYNTPVSAQEARSGQKASVLDNSKDKLTSSTRTPQFEMKQTNGKDQVTVLMQSNSQLIDTNNKQQETIGKLTDLVTKLLDKE